MRASSSMLLCTSCIDAPRFVQWISETGEPGSCDFDPAHGEKPVVTVGDLALEADNFFKENYLIGEEEADYDIDEDRPSYRQRGLLLEEILAEELCTDNENIVAAVIENLPDVSMRDISKGAEAFYDSSVAYERRSTVLERRLREEEDYWYENQFTFQWDDFCSEVQYKRRFFGLEKTLNALFGKVSDYEGGAINPVYVLKSGLKIYRARLLGPNFTEPVLRANPDKELGAPPKYLAQAGRMNVEYIPAFYGAFGERTAVSELRPEIGEEIAIGEFLLKRDVKVFDFTIFRHAPSEQKIETYKHTRYAFIDQMEAEISRRAFSHEKQRQFIPTQIVAEYIKSTFACEAVIYRSSVVSRGEMEDRNIVFLPREDGCFQNVLFLTHSRVAEVDDVRYEYNTPNF